MLTRPDHAWYLYADEVFAPTPTRLLDDSGLPAPGLNGDAVMALAELAAAVHAMAWRLGERELRQLEGFIAMQRWRR